MGKKMRTRKGSDGYDYPYTSPDLVIDSEGKSNTKKFDEVNTQLKDIANIGKLTDLDTTEKSSIVGAINEVFQNASNGKQLIATAITGKGITATKNDTFEQLANKIEQIQGDSVEGLIITINNVKYRLSKNATGDMIATKVKYSITNNLSNATNSNTATEIDNNTSYSANINASAGYKIKTIIVTMDGTNITTNVVIGNAINIANVTGNIVITVTTEIDTDNIVGNINSDNDINLTGLDADTYTLKYEDDNGVLVDFAQIASMEVN